MLTRRIALIGSPAAGKSTIGPLLARALGQTFVDLDALVAREVGDLEEAFIALGEQRYREVETAVVVDALTRGDGLVAVPSGAVTSPQAAQALGEWTVVWLAVDGPTLLARRGLVAHGPVGSLALRSTLLRQLRDRDVVYRALADHEVDTSHASVEQTVTRLQELLATA